MGRLISFRQLSRSAISLISSNGKSSLSIARIPAETLKDRGSSKERASWLEARKQGPLGRTSSEPSVPHRLSRRKLDQVGDLYPRGASLLKRLPIRYPLSAGRASKNGKLGEYRSRAGRTGARSPC